MTMSNLKDKMHDEMLKSSWSNDNGNECLEIWQASEICAAIAEEEAIGFAEWIGKNDYRRCSYCPDKWLKPGMYLKTIQELYNLYQQEKEK